MMCPAPSFNMLLLSHSGPKLGWGRGPCMCKLRGVPVAGFGYGGVEPHRLRALPYRVAFLAIHRQAFSLSPCTARTPVDFLAVTTMRNTCFTPSRSTDRLTLPPPAINPEQADTSPLSSVASTPASLFLPAVKLLLRLGSHIYELDAFLPQPICMTCERTCLSIVLVHIYLVQLDADSMQIERVLSFL